MILEGYIWCIHGLTNKVGQPVTFKEQKKWALESYKVDDIINRKPIDEPVVIESAMFCQLKSQTYRICKHDYVNGKNLKNNLIQVCPIEDVHCDICCHMGLCLKAILHAPD